MKSRIQRVPWLKRHFEEPGDAHYECSTLCENAKDTRLINDVSSLSTIRDNGIEIIKAYGEAGAHYTLLQKKRKIDIVLTTNSDALLFGATFVI